MTRNDPTDIIRIAVKHARREGTDGMALVPRGHPVTTLPPSLPWPVSIALACGVVAALVLGAEAG